MANVLLIRPPDTIVPGYVDAEAGLPLGLLSMAGMLRERGHNVKVFDARVECESESSSWFSPSGQKHFGADWSTLEHFIVQTRPEIVGITNQFSVQLNNALTAASVVKNVDPNILTILGGNHATGCPAHVLCDTNVDFACLGEGELVMANLADVWESGHMPLDIPSLAYCSDGRIVQNVRQDLIANLDSLPIPAYDLVHMERYFELNRAGYVSRTHVDYHGSHRAVSVITSRGCPYRCIFCSIHLTMGRKWRGHSANYVLDHIEHLVRRYDVRHIHFEDDCLNFKLKRFREICDGLTARNLGVTWDVPNGVRADLMSEELLVEAKSSGCTFLWIAAESGVQKVLDQVVKKNLRLDSVQEVAAICSRIGLDLGVYYVIGLPGETVQNMRDTIDFALRLEQKYGAYPLLSIARPTVGTELYRICKEEDYLVGDATAEQLAIALQEGGLIETEQFTREDISRLERTFYARHKQEFVSQFLRFVCHHPTALWHLGKRVAMRPAKSTILNNMVYRHWLLRCNGFQGLQ